MMSLPTSFKLETKKRLEEVEGISGDNNLRYRQKLFADLQTVAEKTLILNGHRRRRSEFLSRRPSASPNERHIELFFPVLLQPRLRYRPSFDRTRCLQRPAINEDGFNSCYGTRCRDRGVFGKPVNTDSLAIECGKLTPAFYLCIGSRGFCRFPSRQGRCERRGQGIL